MDRLMAVVVSLLGAIMALAGVRLTLLAWSMRRWPAAQGEVRSSDALRFQSVGAGQGARYRPEILYAFSVGGKEYTGVRRTLLAWQTSGSQSAEEVVARYPVGKKVTVYYDPRNPRESILIRESALPSAILVTALGLVFCAVFAGWLFR